MNISSLVSMLSAHMTGAARGVSQSAAEAGADNARQAVQGRDAADRRARFVRPERPARRFGRYSRPGYVMGG
jgi:hypothetical protein